ncbi:MAG: PEP/pyruvate-binding domain-containing protein [bacterium]
MSDADFRHVRWLERVTRADLETVGAKAACLGELASGGLTVPAGFVIPADAFAPGVAGALALRDELIAEIRAAYAELAKRTGRAAVAVRSSGVMEDREVASFAGIYRTLLNVSGGDEVVRAVAECLRSSNDEGVARYQRARGIEEGGARLSVLVQDLVNADVAGVAFTLDPLTGESDRIVIDATFGLGAAVVSGAVVPDHFVVARDGGELLDVRLAFKDRQMRPTKDGQGTESIRISHQKAHTPSLNREEIRELCRLALTAERLMGAPQDIEWARARGQFFVLQSRPVTTQPRETVGEERDASGGETGMTTAFLDELVPIPLARFAASFVEPVAVGAIDDVSRWRQVPVERAAVVLGRGAPRWSAGPLEAMARELASPFDRGLDARIRGVGRSATTLERWGVSRALANRRDEISELAIRIESFFWWQSMVNLEGISAPDAVASLGEFQQRLATVLARRVDAVFQTSAVIGLLQSRLDGIPTLSDAERADAWLGVRDHTVGRFLSRLVEIAHLAGEAPKLATILRGEAIEVLPRLEREWSGTARRMRSAVKEVLRDYGHWSAVDLDVSTPSWREDPTPLIALMGRYLELDLAQLPSARLARAVERGEVARRQALEGVAAWRRPTLRHLFDRYVESIRQLIELQDHLSRVTDRARVYVAALASRLTADGKLAAVNEIHSLGFDEVAALAKSDEREGLRRRGVHGAGGATPAASAQPLPRRGKGASPGKVQGTLRRVATPTDLKRLAPGDIAWTPCPGRVWLPYLPILAGLVVDAGAPLALGVVGARELDVPTVIGAGAPPQSLAEGSVISLNGLTGEIELVADAARLSQAAS